MSSFINAATAPGPARCGSPVPLGTKLQALLGPLAKPRINMVTGPDGRLIEEPDPRHYGQRMHDALEDVCDRILRSEAVPESGGTPATVIITIDLEDLLTAPATGSPPTAP